MFKGKAEGEQGSGRQKENPGMTSLKSGHSVVFLQRTVEESYTNFFIFLHRMVAESYTNASMMIP